MSFDGDLGVFGAQELLGQRDVAEASALRGASSVNMEKSAVEISLLKKQGQKRARGLIARVQKKRLGEERVDHYPSDG